LLLVFFADGFEVAFKNLSIGKSTRNCFFLFLFGFSSSSDFIFFQPNSRVESPTPVASAPPQSVQGADGGKIVIHRGKYYWIPNEDL
jgi:hypothetical protein